MENAVIYARVSTQGQDYDRQVDELRAYAQRNGYQIVAKFTEKISGAKIHSNLEKIIICNKKS